MWHDEHSKFKSPAELKIKLIDAFPNDISFTENFQVGYLEPPSNTKRWIVDKRDLTIMYDKFIRDTKITLWCDRSKQDNSLDVNKEAVSLQKKKKRSDKVDNDKEMVEIFHTLKEIFC